MNYTNKYIVPDYYPQFFCKGGSCRANCCHGWDICLTMEEYFRLLGLDCSPALKKKIDVAFYLTDHPTPERYAIFTRAFDGGCPLHDEEGYCSIQRECGEDVLPAPCRYYPRHPNGNECSISCGCEALCEQLFDHKGKLSFIEHDITFSLPSSPQRAILPPEALMLRKKCLDIIQNEELDIKDRFKILGLYLEKYDSLETPEEKQKLEAPSSAEFISVPGGLQYMSDIVSEIARNSPALADLIEEAENYYSTSLAENYENGIRNFEKTYPDWQHMVTMLLANHMFYSAFPLALSKNTRNPINTYPIYTSLCAIYALLRYLSAALLIGKESYNDFADIAAALFRHIDNTNFHIRTSAMLKYYSISADMLCSL